MTVRHLFRSGFLDEASLVMPTYSLAEEFWSMTIQFSVLADFNSIFHLFR